MSDKHDDGGPAFASEQSRNPDGLWNQTIERGMTLRDWFAGQAAASYALSTQTNSVLATEALKLAKKKGCDCIAVIAIMAYRLADEMIAQRKREQA